MQKFKNVLLLICSIVVLFSPIILGTKVAFYISLFFILTGGIYIMMKKNLTIKNDRTILLVLLSMFGAIIMAVSLRYF